MKRLAVLTSGGDAPGMNAALRAITLVGVGRGCEVLGVAHGYRGLVHGELHPLTPGGVGEILREGGTVLGSVRHPAFLERAERDRAREVLAERGVEGLIVIGGNGSLTGARALADPEEAGEDGPKILGIPASIDNDIGYTRMAIGVDTAMNTIVEACDRLADTASSHERTFLVEVMGRDCGYLAMAAGISVGADLVLFPETGDGEDALVDRVVKTVLTVQKRRHPARVIVLVAEGVEVPTTRLRDLAQERLSREAPAGSHGGMEARVTVLGHVVRGGRPSAFDRLLGSRLGNAAVRALMEGRSGEMVAWMPPIDLVGEAGVRSPADPHCWLIGLDEVLAETERVIAGTSPAAAWRARAMADVEDVFRL